MTDIQQSISGHSEKLPGEIQKTISRAKETTQSNADITNQKLTC
jgi:uncharacterized protein YjbJ (UPF0337 family)